MAFRGLSYNPQDAREPVLVASICDRDRHIVETYLGVGQDHEDDKEFRQMRTMMRSNTGIRL